MMLFLIFYLFFLFQTEMHIMEKCTIRKIMNKLEQSKSIFKKFNTNFAAEKGT